MPHANPHRAVRPQVCVLVYDRLCTFEFGLAVEVFGLPRPEIDPWYDFCTVAVDDAPMRATGGITVTADHGLERLVTANLIIVPGWKGVDAPVPRALRIALRDAHARGARVASICSGAFVLAACGLLDGGAATTHWRYAQALQDRFPDLDVNPDVLFIENGTVLTSAGSAAGLDLCLHIVRQDFGAEAANMVARRLVLPAHRDGGQRQFIPYPVPPARGGRIAPLLDRVRCSLNEDWPLSRMADLAGMSVRTLARRMAEATGQTPQAWLTQTRIARAAELLETTSTGMDDIMAACGFNSAETFRRHFRMQIGCSPNRHRKAFPQTGTHGTRPTP